MTEDQGVAEADDINRFERKLDPTATGIARNKAEVERVAESVARREAGEGRENKPHWTPSIPRIDRPGKRGGPLERIVNTGAMPYRKLLA